MSESGDDKGHHHHGGQGNYRRRRIVGGRGGRSRESGGSGRGGGGGGNINSDEKELASQLIQIQSKRFYIDVKENQRGRFIKLAEVGVGGRKSRILMTMGAAAEFKARLVEFSELHSSLGPSHGTNVESSATTANANNNNKRSTSGGGNGENDGLIKSETIVKDRKRYYLDLKENQRGRFLRVSMVVSRGPRAYLAIPAQGLIEFKDHLSDMLEKFGSGENNEEGNDNEEEEDDNSSAGGGGGNRRRRRPAPRSQRDNSEGSAGGGGANKANAASDANLPESKSLRADNKTFYFDCGSNQRGVFLKISEVRQNRYRTSITIPEKYLKQFQEQISQLNLNAGSSAGGASLTSAESTEKTASTSAAPAPAVAPATTTTASGEKTTHK